MKVTHSRDADVNVLLNATFEGSVHDEAALDWLMRARPDSQDLGLFSNVLVSFMRISSWHRLRLLGVQRAGGGLERLRAGSSPS